MLLNNLEIELLPAFVTDTYTCTCTSVDTSYHTGTDSVVCLLTFTTSRRRVVEDKGEFLCCRSQLYFSINITLSCNQLEHHRTTAVSTFGRGQKTCQDRLAFSSPYTHHSLSRLSIWHPQHPPSLSTCTCTYFYKHTKISTFSNNQHCAVYESIIGVTCTCPLFFYTPL